MSHRNALAPPARGRFAICLNGAARRWRVDRTPRSEAQVGYDVSGLVFDPVGTPQAFERGLGFLIAGGRRFLVIGLGGGLVLWPTAPALRKNAHPLQRA